MSSLQTVVLIAFLAGFGIALGVHFVLQRISKASAYAKGHADGSHARQPLIDDLNALLEEHRTELIPLREAKAQQRQILDSIIEDADRRITIYARRANPFTQDDADQLLAMAEKLSLSANTFAGIRAHDHATAASRLSGQAKAMALRLTASLQQAEADQAQAEAAA